jgi:hypothetical protein
MYEDDEKTALRFILKLFLALAILSALMAGVGRVAGLFWFPWEIRMKTGMIRASNSYITTQQAALRQFRLAYDDAGTDGQRAGLVRQMREIADTIPGDVQPDIASFLSSH